MQELGGTMSARPTVRLATGRLPQVKAQRAFSGLGGKLLLSAALSAVRKERWVLQPGRLGNAH